MSLFERGFNFRATAGYVSDGAGETYVLDELYPTVRDDITFGWDLPITEGNVSPTPDVRIAGYHAQYNGGSQKTFRVNVNPGVYAVMIGAGRVQFGTNNIQVDFYDNATLRLSVKNFDLVTTNDIVDIEGDLRTIAQWQAEQLEEIVEIASGILFVRLGTLPATSDNTRLNHLYLRQLNQNPLGTIQVADKRPSIVINEAGVITARTKAPVNVSVAQAPETVVYASSAPRSIVASSSPPAKTITIGRVAGVGEDPMSVLAKEIDDQTAADGTGMIYRGYAGAGVASSAAAWRIERLEIVEDVGGRQDITTRFAQKDGAENAGFVHVWDDRLSLSYGP